LIVVLVGTFSVGFSALALSRSRTVTSPNPSLAAIFRSEWPSALSFRICSKFVLTRGRPSFLPFARAFRIPLQGVNGADSAILGFLSPNAGAPDADETTWSATCQVRAPVSVGMGATQREGVRGGSVTLPYFILSFILRHRPIFDVSDFPMLLGFRFSTDRTIDSNSVSFYHFLWDF
jgi:hypothetical protein